MNYVVIDGVPPWDGRYPFDDFSFTNRELYAIRQSCGLRASELIEALEANDTSAYVSVASVVLRRNDVQVDVDDLWDAKVGSIGIELAADDADPPTQPAGGNDSSSTETSSGSDSGSGGE